MEQGEVQHQEKLGGTSIKHKLAFLEVTGNFKLHSSLLQNIADKFS